MAKRLTIGTIISPEDKKMIVEASKVERRSIASFMLEASIRKAEMVLKEVQNDRETAITE